MVEFALVLPLLLLLLVGMIQFGLALFRFQGLQAAAREGGRIASIPTKSQSQIISQVNASLSELPLGSATPVVTVTPSTTFPCQGRSGQSVTVSISYANPIDIPLVPTINKTLQAISEFRCE